MAYVRCPACHKHISSAVTFCPGCGKPKPKGGWAKPGKAFRSILIGFFTMMVLVNAFMTFVAP